MSMYLLDGYNSIKAPIMQTNVYKVFKSKIKFKNPMKKFQ